MCVYAITISLYINGFILLPKWHLEHSLFSSIVVFENMFYLLKHVFNYINKCGSMVTDVQYICLKE